VIATRTRLALTAAVAAAIAILLFVSSQSGGYVLKAVFRDASGLRTDFFVKIGGVPVGRVAGVSLTANDTALVTMEIDSSALPIGRDATATIRPASLLGEHYVEINPGNLSDPAPSGTVLGLNRTSTAIALDQVLAGLDNSTQVALGVFLREAGDAMLGRGRDLGRALLQLPPTIDDATTILGDLGQDNGALGRLVSDSDQVLSAIAARRDALGRLVVTGEHAVRSFANGSASLERGIGASPAAITQLTATLARLRTAAQALPAAADGLRASAAPLTATLQAVVPFARAATPTLDDLGAAAPALASFARRAQPPVSALVPVAGDLASVATAFGPLSGVLQAQIEQILGALEGYARAMAATDSLGHIYHPVNTVANQVSVTSAPARVHRHRPAGVAASAVRPQPVLPQTALSTPAAPIIPQLLKLPALPHLGSAGSAPGRLGSVLRYLLGR